MPTEQSAPLGETGEFVFEAQLAFPHFGKSAFQRFDPRLCNVLLQRAFLTDFNVSERHNDPFGPNSTEYRLEANPHRTLPVLD